VIIGDIIKTERKKKKLTQKYLATEIGKSERMLQKYENGEVTPSIEVIEKISEILEVPIFSLLTRDTNFSINLIASIQKAYINLSNGSPSRDICLFLSQELNLDYQQLNEVVNEHDKELPISIQLKLLQYLYKIDHEEFLSFCDSNNDLIQKSKPMKHLYYRALGEKITNLETESLTAFENYLLITFGDKIKEFTNETDLEELQKETNKFLEFSLYKMEQEYYGEDIEDED
jgi:transcriptional regulator with XRE-family HTH domain